ncbi:PP2C family protein-serine/threonine phosphatase [Granulicoccus sp. GXG6511]|uniref:PP2C family protein-serine/threonine phosphatase n=1 Tax=Granulicoccus sp. GXG6511 TaxID=3381351 RepID=UPI003D7ECF3B
MNEPFESVERAVPDTWQVSGPPAAAGSTRCPSCGDEVTAWEAFCEGCGAQLTPTEARPAELVADEVPVSRVLQADEPGSASARACLECGGRIDPDGYCEQCGAKAPSERDHFVESPATWVGGVCDRGVRHHRNEDAMALSADPVPGSHAVLVVCDGVSSSDDSHLASLAAARAARGVLVARHPVGMAVPESQVAARTATFTEAVAAANEAIVAGTDPASTNAPSCTIAAAEVDGDLIVWGNIGDSRVYWMADTGPSRQLSVDDSMAQLRMTAGVPRAEAESGPGSHAITRWLGMDAPDLIPTTGHLQRPGNGWLLVCSDGLWNYASDPEDLEVVFARILLANPAAADPSLLALELVRWANAQGGKDNITVALARFGSLDGFPGRTDASLESPIEPGDSTPTVHTVPVRTEADPEPQPSPTGEPDAATSAARDDGITDPESAPADGSPAPRIEH